MHRCVNTMQLLSNRHPGMHSTAMFIPTSMTHSDQPSAAGLSDVEHNHQRMRPLWGILAVIACTLLAWPLRDWLSPAIILMIYNLGVFLVAASYGRGASIVASVLSIPAFAFFFAPPIFSFAISDIQNLLGLLVMLLVANLTSNLLEHIQFQAKMAQLRKNQASALNRLMMDLANTLTDKTLAQVVVPHLFEEFKVLSVLLLPNAEGKLAYPLELPTAYSLTGANLQHAQYLYVAQNATPQNGLPPIIVNHGLLYIPLLGSQGVVGVIAMQTIEADYQTFLQTYLHQVGLTLERLYLAAQARAALLQAEAEASRNSLLSAISHDLRTPLTRIIGATNTVIENYQLAELERTEIHKVIRDEAQHMSELMNKILDMARLAEGTLVLHCEWYALEEIIGGALARMEKVLELRDIKIDLPENLPLIWIDGVLLQQVLINLFENIAKYTPAGSPIDINATVANNTLSLSVADFGPGVPENHTSDIFEKFYRYHAESSTHGIGLGLALCRSIMQAHQGEIIADNRAEGGACFTLSLPLHPAPLIHWREGDLK